MLDNTLLLVALLLVGLVAAALCVAGMVRNWNRPPEPLPVPAEPAQPPSKLRLLWSYLSLLFWCVTGVVVLLLGAGGLWVKGPLAVVRDAGGDFWFVLLGIFGVASGWTCGRSWKTKGEDSPRHGWIGAVGAGVAAAFVTVLLGLVLLAVWQVMGDIIDGLFRIFFPPRGPGWGR